MNIYISPSLLITTKRFLFDYFSLLFFGVTLINMVVKYVAIPAHSYHW